MKPAEPMTGSQFASAMGLFEAQLNDHRDLLNRLNVFPVPDGDTGTNMSATVAAVVQALEAEKLFAPQSAMAEVAASISHSSLMAARGNSGVILSQILRGLCRVLGTEEQADASQIAKAILEASVSAREAVQSPVEGTMLTIIERAAEAVKEPGRVKPTSSPSSYQSNSSTSTIEILELARDAALEALWLTTAQLVELKNAGVVDSGAAGVVLLLESILAAVSGLPPRGIVLPAAMSTKLGVAQAIPMSGVVDAGKERGCSPRFEVMYLLDCADSKIQNLRNSWTKIGDSIVVVGGDGIWNCHIHTDDIGAAVEAGIEIGRPHRIRVSDLTKEVEEEAWVRADLSPSMTGARHIEQSNSWGLNHGEPKTLLICFAQTSELKEAYLSLGADIVVNARQGAEGAVQEALKRWEDAPTATCVVLLGGHNCLEDVVSKKLAESLAGSVHFLDCDNAAGTLAALSVYDPDAVAEASLQPMKEALNSLTVVSVIEGPALADGSVAAEPGRFVAYGSTVGETIGQTRSDSPIDAARSLLDKVIKDHHDVITILFSDRCSQSDVQSIVEWLESNRPGLAVDVLSTGATAEVISFGLE